jgi:hypothetical protein
LFLVGEEVGADVYSIRHAAPELRQGLETFDRAATSMREHLHRVGIRGFCPAICVTERAEEGLGWSATIPGGVSLWSSVTTATIERLWAGQAVLHAPAASRRRVQLRIPQGSVVARALREGAEGTDQAYLGLPPGYLLSSVELSAEEWEILQAADAEGSLEEAPSALIEKAARAGLIGDSPT